MKEKDLKKTILRIVGKTSDSCSSILIKDGKVLKDHTGYVPELMPGQHYGDYIEIDIDVETGLILNWKKPTKAQLEQFIKTGK